MVFIWYNSYLHLMSDPTSGLSSNGDLTNDLENAINALDSEISQDATKAKFLARDKDYLDFRNFLRDLSDLVNSFYKNRTSDEKTGFDSINRVFSEISPIRNGIIDSVAKVKGKLKEEQAEWRTWIENQKDHFLRIASRVVYDAANYLKEIASKLGVTSYSLTVGTFGTSATFSFDVSREEKQ